MNGANSRGIQSTIGTMEESFSNQGPWPECELQSFGAKGKRPMVS